MLKVGGLPVVAGQYGAWAPIGAEQTASGYYVAWKAAGADQYAVWRTDSNGSYITNFTGTVSGNSAALKELETTFRQDLNGDGVIGVVTTVIEAFGTTSLTKSGDTFYLKAGGSGPVLKAYGSPVVAGQYGAWAPIGAEQTASGYYVAWKAAGADQYAAWRTDSNGNYITNFTGTVSGNSAVLKELETTFRQDLNGDGVVGVAATPVSGVCGSANGTKVSSKPSANLCSAGTASSVAGSGPWTWSCGGSNSGATATCTASLATPTTRHPTSTPTPTPTHSTPTPIDFDANTDANAFVHPRTHGGIFGEPDQHKRPAKSRP